MVIGILKESVGENRVALIPEHIAALKKLKTEVVFEPNAGQSATVPDNLFEQADAVKESREEVIKKADLLVCISVP